MGLTNTSSKPRRRFRRQTAGFTLIEVSISSVIGLFIAAGVLSTYIVATRGFSAITNYWHIHSDGRMAVDRFSADMRATCEITSFATNGPLVVRVPISFLNSGAVQTYKTVTYSYSNGALNRTDSSTGTTSMLATNIYALKFQMYNRVGNKETVISNSKSISMELFLRKYTVGRAQTEDFLSARLNMRNKP